MRHYVGISPNHSTFIYRSTAIRMRHRVDMRLREASLRILYLPIFICSVSQTFLLKSLLESMSSERYFTNLSNKRDIYLIYTCETNERQKEKYKTYSPYLKLWVNIPQDTENCRYTFIWRCTYPFYTINCVLNTFVDFLHWNEAL